ncbi:MAG: transcription-repair coupling factor [Nitrospiraceae bacterium]|nr:transcription-repair coupling factor [Nitrospiraceae bacterium]
MDILTLINDCFPGPVPESCRIYNLAGSSAALFLALQGSPFVAVEQDEDAARALRKDIVFYRKMFRGQGAVLFLPDPDGPEAAGERAGLVSGLSGDGSVVTSSLNLSSALWDAGALEREILLLKKGDAVDRNDLEEFLVLLGYRKTPMVSEKGEYSRREWIIDIFPSTAERPARIEFFGDEIEQIKPFEIETQRSAEETDSLRVFPAKEPDEVRDLSAVIRGRKFFCLYPAADGEGFPKDTIFLSRYAFEEGVTADDGGEGRETASLSQIDAGMRLLKGIGILPDERKSLDELPENIRLLSRENRILIVSSSAGQSERLRDLFREADMIVPVIGPDEFPRYEGTIAIAAGGLSSGIFMKGLLILTEKELFGERPAFRSIKKSKVASLLVSLDDITPGDFVVHRDHGIGRFQGVTRQQRGGSELELMTLEYEDGRLYLPVQSISVISKFRSEEGASPRLDRLGGKSWQKKKERARKRVRQIAEKLLALYADRSVARGFSFSGDTDLHREFESFFAYEETPDQLKAISDIKKDMESGVPMDRLLCGDVGYGKTEVAMRAAFKAVYDNRQVAVLVPTTILAEQHYRTFRERFSGFPVNTDFLSRFKTAKEATLTMKKLADGETDIVIGTHGLLSKKASFARLGLLIVDEEHRFGVGQKERIKEMSRNVDVLTLTATPIPRTLHMALSGIRNISVIETPPEERLSVKSVVAVFQADLIRKVISAELQRNGQVFFVHNRIADIYRVAGSIQELVPGASIGVAHGQMPEKQLEEIMHRFFDGEVGVLVSTAIIGAGLDIPRANTIVIDRADRMGLADLYQLRGRVGRSNIKGHAYFLAPPESTLTEEARKRLQAVQEMSYLGAGFRLALKDLEIRGAGEIFGAEQSGHINEIGFDTYIEMLENAVAELKGEEIKEDMEPVIELKVSAFISEDYIADVTLRLSFYRRIASLRTGREIDDFEKELKDRFGPLPAEAGSLLKVARIKALARRLLVTKIGQGKDGVRVFFSPDTPVQPDHIFDLQTQRKKTVRFFPDGFELAVRGGEWEKVYEEVRGTLEELAAKTAAVGAEGPADNI